MPDPERRLALAQRVMSWALLIVGTVYTAWVILVMAICVRDGQLPDGEGLRRLLLYPLAGAAVGLGGGFYLRRATPWSG